MLKFSPIFYSILFGLLWSLIGTDTANALIQAPFRGHKIPHITSQRGAANIGTSTVSSPVKTATKGVKRKRRNKTHGRTIAEAQSLKGRKQTNNKRRLAEEKTNLSPTEALPDELNLEIFQHLDPKTLNRVKRVKRSWYRAANDPQLHEARYKEQLQQFTKDAKSFRKSYRENFSRNTLSNSAIQRELTEQAKNLHEQWTDLAQYAFANRHNLKDDFFVTHRKPRVRQRLEFNMFEELNYQVDKLLPKAITTPQPFTVPLERAHEISTIVYHMILDGKSLRMSSVKGSKNDLAKFRSLMTAEEPHLTKNPFMKTIEAYLALVAYKANDRFYGTHASLQAKKIIADSLDEALRVFDEAIELNASVVAKRDSLRMPLSVDQTKIYSDLLKDRFELGRDSSKAIPSSYGDKLLDLGFNDKKRLYRVCESYFCKQQWDETAKYTEELIKMGDQSSRAFSLLGKAHFERKQWRKAAKAFESAMAPSKDGLKGPELLKMGKAYSEMKEWDKASQALQRVKLIDDADQSIVAEAEALIKNLNSKTQ